MEETIIDACMVRILSHTKRSRRDLLKHSGHWCLLLASGDEPWDIRHRSLAHQWLPRARHLLCMAHSDGIAPRASSC